MDRTHVVTVRAPASTANLGPAFDCLALALDLWNETRVELTGEVLVLDVSGEGAETLPRDQSNRIVQAMARVYAEVGEKMPKGLHIDCKQRIPPGSGIGSSAAATATGLLAANWLLGQPQKVPYLLQLGAELEGHADNLAAALLGGLVLVTQEAGGPAAQKLECESLSAVVIRPEQRLTTTESRKALPKQVSLSDAVFNIGHSIQVIEALRNGDIPALANAFQDRLHQPYRLSLIPGAAEALAASQLAGAAAALSGAGPSLIAFVDEGREKSIAEALRAPFAGKGIKTQQYLLKSTTKGAEIIPVN
ncbi:MAG: homoserine kinase [Chloroflexi bacterium]|nr:homoserine kinase [Chloroflexota bacterium]